MTRRNQVLLFQEPRYLHRQTLGRVVVQVDTLLVFVKLLLLRHVRLCMERFKVWARCVCPTHVLELVVSLILWVRVHRVLTRLIFCVQPTLIMSGMDTELPVLLPDVKDRVAKRVLNLFAPVMMDLHT
jgi:hypothetical protein